MSATAPWQDLGAYLHDARHRTAFTQYHIARQLGITQAAYSQIERGLIRPRPALLLPLAVLLGVGLGHLAALAGYPLEQIATAGWPKRTARGASGVTHLLQSSQQTGNHQSE